jgi:DNA-binding CsgD family transcriptional regulator
MANISALPAIYNAATSDQNWQQALDEFAAASGAKSSTLYATNTGLFDFQFQAASSLVVANPDVLQTFLKNYAAFESQSSAFMQASPLLKRVEDVEIWPGFLEMRDREDLAFLQRELGLFRRVGYNLASGPAWGGFVALQYDKCILDFRPGWIAQAEALTPHLSKAMEINRFCSQLRKKYQAVLTVLNRVDVALFLCLKTGEVIVQNDRASEIFAERNGIELSSAGLLQLRDGKDAAQVLAHVAECANTARGEGDRNERVLAVRKRNLEEPYLMEVSPLRDGADELNDGFAGALVMVVDPVNPPHLPVKSVTALYGLTQAESDVVELLIAGNTLNNIAEIRGVSPETIRSQSKRSYDKLGVRNRADLVRKITGILPPILG